MVDSTVELNPLTNIKSEVDPLSDIFSSVLGADDSTSRLSQYKSRIRYESDQEERRRLLLQRQKEKRTAKFNERRSVKEDKGNDWSKEEDFIEDDSEMEWSTVKEVAWHKRGKMYNNMLMFSEWLIDVPNDFSTKWIMVPCPVGKRNLIVSKQNHCTSYSKKGVALYYFKSALPPKTILDSIWCFKTKSFYVFDVIQWNGMSFKNCQTDFRFYWLNSKFQENPEYSIQNEENQYPLILLNHCSCDLNNITENVKNYPFFKDNCPRIDGILFYHSETHYTSGRTPLVGWLKPYMLSELFSIQINSEYNAEKPEEYVSFIQFMNEKENRKKEFRDKRKNKMECEVIECEDNKESLLQGDELDCDNENGSFDVESCDVDSMNNMC